MVSDLGKFRIQYKWTGWNDVYQILLKGYFLRFPCAFSQCLLSLGRTIYPTLSTEPFLWKHMGFAKSKPLDYPVLSLPVIG